MDSEAPVLKFKVFEYWLTALEADLVKAFVAQQGERLDGVSAETMAKQLFTWLKFRGYKVSVDL